MRTCIVVELTDGSFRAFAFPSEDIAAAWYQECRAEWNEARNLVFHVRSRRGPSVPTILDGDTVAHLELASHEDVDARGIRCSSAVTFG